MYNSNEILTIDYAVINEATKHPICFDLSEELLLASIEKIKSKLSTGQYYIYKVLQYATTQKLIKTEKYIVVL